MASSQILIKKDEDQSIKGRIGFYIIVMAFCANSMSILGDVVRVFDYHSFVFSGLASCLCD
jgi:hypothetical protein